MRKWYAVIGDPIEHSMSPLMHNAWMAEESRDASYIPIHVQPENLEQAVASLKLLGCSGWNITIPHKEKIIPYLDELDESARKMGAVNTVVRQPNGTYKGYNTDGLGFVRSLEDEIGDSHRDEQVLIIGAGGAARGIAFALVATGYRHITIANRTVSKAQAICDELDITAKAISLTEAAEQLSGFEILVQTTSAGLNHSAFALPIAMDRLSSTAIVADIVYNPLMTPFLIEAKKKGATVITGLGMFIHQGALAYSYWTDTYPKAKVVRHLLLEHLGGK
ncbi:MULTISPECIES: shikimate dehydrogenase [Rummeliibacillus]|uniref:shikimate dehydrogenase n=1 Tax=Rummeliibacillus TaxID=648802 RepID=UPI0011B736F5|nr:MULTISPECIES: shikimate dehydrogenase [Rummeliibacillus]